MNFTYDAAWHRPPPPPGCGYRTWLRERGSLTRRIQLNCARFGVRAVRQERAAACRDEAALVGLRHKQQGLVREVFLYCGKTPVVFAHTVLERAALRRAWHMLAGLGEKPLGAALFADPKVRRAPLRFKKLGRHDPLYLRACRALDAPPPCLWARRSLFYRHGFPLLVTEVFLPGILALAP